MTLVPGRRPRRAPTAPRPRMGHKKHRGGIRSAPSAVRGGGDPLAGVPRPHGLEGANIKIGAQRRHETQVSLPPPTETQLWMRKFLGDQA